MNPELKGKVIRDIPIRMMDELETVLQEENIDIAAPQFQNKSG